MNVISGSEGSITTPTWELLPQVTENQTHLGVPSAELENAAQPLVAASEDFNSLQLKEFIKLVSRLPKYDMRDGWTITEKVAVNGNSSDTIISTDPAVIEKLSSYKTHEHKDGIRRSLLNVPSIIGFFTIEAAAGFGGGLSGYKAAILTTAPEFVALTAPVGSVGGSVAGVVATFWALCGAVRGLELIQYKTNSFVHDRQSKTIGALVTKSSQTYIIPNQGVVTNNLGKDVAKVLHDAESPQELLLTRIAPLVTTIMQMEVELGTIEPELQEIKTRTAAIGTSIEEDQINQGELTKKKQNLLDMAQEKRKALAEIHESELKTQFFKEKFLEILPEKLMLSPESQEFFDGVADVVQVAYTPNLKDTTDKAIDTLLATLKTVDDEKLLQPVYEALREKWAKEGLVLPDFEMLDQRIAQSRDLR